MLRNKIVWLVVVLIVSLSVGVSSFDNNASLKDNCIHRYDTATNLPFYFNFAFAHGNIEFKQLMTNETTLNVKYFFISLLSTIMTYEIEWNVLTENDTIIQNWTGESYHTYWLNPYTTPISRPFIYGEKLILFPQFVKGEAWIRIYFLNKLIFEDYCNYII